VWERVCFWVSFNISPVCFWVSFWVSFNISPEGFQLLGELTYLAGRVSASPVEGSTKGAWIFDAGVLCRVSASGRVSLCV
jgi:hypothetical protein